MRPTLARNNSHHSHDANATKNFRNRSGGVLKHFRSYKRASTLLAAFVVAATLIASLVVWRVQAHRSDAQAAIKTASTQSRASLPMDWQRAKRSAFARILAPDPFAAPSILTSVSSLPDFGSVNVGSASAEQTYTVSGSNLTADITVTAPSTDFEVSETTGTGFGPSITFTQSGGSVPTSTVFVRFTPQSTGLKSGDVTNESTGATTQNVAVSGTGDPVPPPSTSVVSLNRTSGSPTKELTADWSIVFADAVDGLTAANFAVVNTGLGGSPAVESVGNPSGILPSTTWNITVTTGTGEGTLGLDMVNDTGVTHDVTNLPFTGEVYTVDQVAPSTTSFTRQDPNPTNADTLVFRATFSEDVTLVDTTDFAVMGTTTATPTSVDPVSNSVYDVTVSGGDLAGFNGDVGLDFSGALDITDIAGNALPNAEPTTDETYTLQQIPASLVVNTTADADDGFCTTDEAGCTLREAINAANSDLDTNTITFDIPSPGPDVIVLELGQLQITESVDINGPIAKGTTVDGNNGTRVFAVFAGTVNISDLTIAHASAGGGGGGGGGGIRNAASLTLSNVTISGNSAGGGAGIANTGTLNVTNSTISGNSAGTDGGGIANRGTLNVTNSTISGNSASNSGGGIYNTGSGTLSLLNVTITNNTADQGDGGGVFDSSGASEPFIARNTIIAGNIDTGGEAPDVAGTLNSLGHNLIGDGTGSTVTVATGDQVGTTLSPINPRLAPLGNYGGPTQTHALLVNSPAIDAGDDCVFTGSCATPALITDQRGAGHSRQLDGPDVDTTATVDIGSFELNYVAATGPTFEVNSTADTDDGSCDPQGTGGGNMDCTLREAINAANASSDPNTIEFGIGSPGDGVQTISPQTNLPAIIYPVTIDGYSQLPCSGPNPPPCSQPNTDPGGDNANLLIELNGSDIDSSVPGIGLDIIGGGSTVKGLAINRFMIEGTGAAGIRLSVAGGNTITGNFIGTDAAGIANRNLVGVLIDDVPNNIIGGPITDSVSAAARNLISANFDDGVQIKGVNAIGNTIQGNFIGTDKSGASIEDDNSAETGNGVGIEIYDGSDNIVGNSELAGPAVTGAGNVISGNLSHGIEISSGAVAGPHSNGVGSNFIGTDLTEAVALRNGGDGIQLSSDSTNNLVGGSTSEFRNVIANNGGNGVNVLDSAPSEFRNVIANNSGNGVHVLDIAGTGNQIRLNSIYSNDLLGIDLGGDGVTLNDSGDGDPGANNLQNFPVITSASISGGMITVSGNLNSTPEQGTTFKIDIYANSTCNDSSPNDYGEGKTYLGSVMADGDGNPFTFGPTTMPVGAGTIITATATDATGNTSEFSLCFEATGPTAADGTVSGQIVDGNGNPVEGAGVRMSGTQNRLTVTDRAGNYHFDSVEAGGFYTVTPSRANYLFSPGQRSFSQIGQHTDAVFTASATSTGGGGLNPLETTEYFVRQQYLDFLSREPDEAGFNFWVNNIAACGADSECLSAKRIDTSAAFFISIEFQQTGYLVYRLYQSAYGDIQGAPVPLKFSEFRPDTEVIGRGVVVNQSGWEAKLEANKQAFASEFVERARFRSAYPVTMTPREFVDRLFLNGGVTPGESDRAAAINEFAGASDTADAASRARAVRRVAENATLQQQEFNQAFVLMQYFGYLGRDPNTAPDTDFSGYNFWLHKLDSFNGDFRKAEMVKAFLVAGEYRGRFPR